jgi:hypothetical protein
MSLQVYTPYVCEIVEIESLGLFTLVTTAIVHTFVIGNLVRFQIPQEYGMRELNPLKAYVYDVPQDDQVLLVLDSSTFTPFVVPTVDPLIVLNPAQIIPAGDANSGTLAPGGVLESRTIPGAYQAVVTN